MSTVRLIFAILIVLLTFGLFFDFVYDGKLSTLQAFLVTLFTYIVFAAMFIVPYRLIFGG